MKWCIKRKSNVGQQIEQIYDKENEKWVKEMSYCEPSFRATKTEARELRKQLSEGYRGKWVRLYEITG